MFKALTIAGSDSSGGAGIQTGIKTFQERGIYVMSSHYACSDGPL